ncbi:ribosomal protein S18 acetylase RimI-like enzyme [Curtobacterium sp. PhB130]|uniref:GNAT family N-acetyltransferase n=1 Tax=Curtobacterium sp. PhB130 TaxID=2485178 RepID=UPI000F4C5DB9|nr:GNAT family N-acetyltransferase [Curtobacterium sp. PhB130]ROS77406.1 ribosomal protein S18 acetylase RimI-like enzyme [Curtobacterium sp. PhB130]
MTVTFSACSVPGDGLEAVLAFTTDEPVAWIGADRYRQESAAHNYRPEWSWLAVRDGQPVGRALWWGGADASIPSTLDDVVVAVSDPDERVAIASGLITAGAESFGTLPEWIVDVAVDWESDPRAVAAVGWRADAARAAGLTRMTERVSVAWTPASDVPSPAASSGLTFRGGADDEFLDLFRRVTVGSLDAHTQATVAQLGPSGTAADDLAFYRSLPGSRDDWRIAADPDGLTVGFVLATRTAYDAAISYIGVLPQHRGRGVVDALLAEGLRVHDAAGEPRVVATTDAANTPMRRAFERAGFTVTKRRIVFDS